MKWTFSFAQSASLVEDGILGGDSMQTSAIKYGEDGCDGRRAREGEEVNSR